MKLTEKLALKKPDLTDYVSVSDLNDNMDILDEEVGSMSDDLGAYKADMSQLIRIKKNITILSAKWTKAGELYQYNILDADITEDTVVDVNIHLADLDKASRIKSANLSSVGKVTLYVDDKPDEDILCDLKLIRQVI